MTDIILYNGSIERGADLTFINFLSENKKNDDLILVLTTPGGNPDAAYKIGRYIHDLYGSFKIFVPGLCKSAGTLLAIAADEIIFSPYGELGPLDVQLAKSDHLFEQDSGLNISEAFKAVEDRAKSTFHDLIAEIISGSGGRISFPTASHCASEIIASLYGPIFSTIDPEEVGARTRAMRIGEDYGVRLNQKFKNLKYDSLNILSSTYSSHSFVIDYVEARVLFERVRMSTQNEKKLIELIGTNSRIPSNELIIKNFTAEFNAITEDSNNVREKKNETKQRNRKNSTEATKKSNGTNSSAASASKSSETST